MRVPTLEPRRRFRLRGWIIGAAVVLVVLLFSLRGLAGFYTDYLWFDSLGQGSTWSSLLAARVAPALVFTIVFFVIMFVNLVIADRLAPKYRSMGPEDELIARYQQVAGPYTMRIRIGVSLFFALIAGIGVSAQWKQWVLFTHYQSFHKVDPQFHKDIGFYVFQLPFLKFIAEWLFAGLVIVLIVTAVEHYLNGGIRFQSPFQRVTPQVKAHLSVILAVMALVKTAQYYLGRFELNFSTRGVVEGASYTDVKAQLPALNLLIFISIGAAGLFLWNIRRRGLGAPDHRGRPLGLRVARDRHDLPGGGTSSSRSGRTSTRPRRSTSTATSGPRATRSASTPVESHGLQFHVAETVARAARRTTHRRRRAT